MPRVENAMIKTQHNPAKFDRKNAQAQCKRHTQTGAQYMQRLRQLIKVAPTGRNGGGGGAEERCFA